MGGSTGGRLIEFIFCKLRSTTKTIFYLKTKIKNNEAINKIILDISLLSTKL